jgi:RNA polymerase sigma-70 factor (ECF subfamily)
MPAGIISADIGFSELVTRIRNGEEAAAHELVRRYEFTIRVAVRIRLSDPALRRQFDSMDICQSVLGSFFLHVSSGAYTLDDPRQLVALLTEMAKNKLAMHARQHTRRRRDIRRTKSLDAQQNQLPSREVSPYQQVADRDQLALAYKMMGPAVCEMIHMRMAGTPWEEVATRLGGTADARRKQYQRALGQTARKLLLSQSTC